jgi:phosphorylcholine metabolism protein LicD
VAKLIVLGQEVQEKEALPEGEQNIAESIMHHAPEEYDAILCDAGWEQFCQMSSLREGLVNWYPFQKDSDILEISGGYGALTGVLARSAGRLTVLEESLTRAECIAQRCGEYENVTVFAGCWKQLFQRQEYDYVVVEEAVNTRRELDALVDMLAPFLKESGRLLFVCENRFGMKYWCGVPDSVTQKPFAGLRGRGDKQLMTRQDLLDALEQNPVIRGYHLYYPFPDHILPQAVYSDRYLPSASIRDRVIPYYPAKERESMVCLENEICDELIANKVLPVFSNSFLAECGKVPFEAETAFAALSVDRGNAHGFATVITNRGTVQKRVLHPLGRSSLEAIHRHHQALTQNGVCCVPETWTEDMIEMPFVEGESLIEHLKYLFDHKPEQVEEVFDLLYGDILRSSEQVPFAECAIEAYELTEENAGVILKQAYLDMIPYNSFLRDGRIMFYDQEFVREGFPAKYVIFRALRYTYIYIPEADGILPLQYFKEKYGLAGIWQVFEREEAKFVEENRNYERMSSFYRWAQMNPNEMDANARKLTLPQEEKPDHTAVFRRHRYDLAAYANDLQLQAVKAVQLKLLKELARVCEENDLSYCVFYGTLLGTVRHHGFVPWDDDVDVLMPRADYDRLLEIAPQQFGVPFFLQTPENEEGCFYGGYSKLRDSRTTGVEERNRGNRCNQGIWIDIFPLDWVLADEDERKEQQERILFYQGILLKKAYPDKRLLWHVSEQEEETIGRISRFFDRGTVCRELHDAIVAEGKEKSDQVAVIARYRGTEPYTKYDGSDFAFLIKRKFEDMQVYVPVGYESCLRVEYGDNYALYPENWNRTPHHRAFFDSTKSYIDYLREIENN